MTGVTALLALMLDTVSFCETTVIFYETTRHNSSRDSHLLAYRHENLKSHTVKATQSVFEVLTSADIVCTCERRNSYIIMMR